MTEIGGVQLPFMPAGGVETLRKSTNGNSDKSVINTFDTLLNDELNKVKFSGHAESRMKSRDINLSQIELLKLEDAIDRAEAKNANESLVFMDDKAFIVSVAKRTVITAFSKDQLNSNVITNIDSVVMA